MTPTYLLTLSNTEEVSDWILTIGNCMGYLGHHREGKKEKLQQQKRRLEKPEHRVRAGTTKQCTCSFLQGFPKPTQNFHTTVTRKVQEHWEAILQNSADITVARHSVK